MLLMKQISGLLTALGLKADASALSSHTSNTNNPHGVTKAQVGLGNCDNTSDANKPVSNAQQTALNAKADQTDFSNHLSADNPHGLDYNDVGADPTGAAASEVSDHETTYDHSKLHNQDSDSMLASGTGNQVTASELRAHVDSESNPHDVTKSQVGLGNVGNYAQVKKAASSTDGKVPKWSGLTGDQIVDGYAVESGTLSGSSDALVRADLIKAMFDNIVGAADAMVYKGVIDCSLSPDYPAGDKGSTWKVSAAGKIGGTGGPNVEVGDMIICTEDGQSGSDHATVGEFYNIIQRNEDGLVSGPATTVDLRIAVFDGASGKTIKDGGYRIGDMQLELAAVQDIVSPSANGSPGNAITIPNAFSQTPSSAVPVLVYLNGLLVPAGDPDTENNRWERAENDLKISPDSSFALETTDEITILYSV